jgi:DNA-binding response OmpR family regulator
VDDEADLTGSLVRLLRRFGHTCLTTSSGREAIDMIDTDRLDLVVTDLQMPEVDGMAVIRSARGKQPPIPVILMTAYPAVESRFLVTALGAVYLSKPFANADFLRAVEEALASP